VAIEPVDRLHFDLHFLLWDCGKYCSPAAVLTAVVYERLGEAAAGYLCASLIGAIPLRSKLPHTVTGSQMQATSVIPNRRRQDRVQAVLPVRVRGTDASGASFEALAHTLDLTPTGARLGAIRHELKVLETLTIFYHQRRMEFRVVWTKLLDGKSEYQVGLQAFSQEREAWGMSLNFSVQPATAAISGAA
jgi:hypothetical protein